MIEKTVVALLVVVAALYAFRALAPSAWLSRRVAATSAALGARGWSGVARWVAAYAPSSDGCGGCGTCDGAATSAANARADDGASPRDAAVSEKPVVFHRRPPR